MLTDQLATTWLASLTGCYASLHHDNPEISGAYVSEVMGIIRCPVIWTDPVSKTIWNSSAISFAGMPSAVVTYLGLWDAAINGNLLAAQELDAEILVPFGGSFALEPLSVAFSID